MSATEGKENVAADESRETSRSQSQSHEADEKEREATNAENGSSTNILIKLKNILDGVSAQEADLNRKTRKLDEWCALHHDTLRIAQQTKQQLIEFEVVNEDDGEHEKSIKQQNKKEINENLDKLEQYLKKLSWREKKYRCKDCIEGESKNEELVAEHERILKQNNALNDALNLKEQEITEHKERETAHRALMLKWQAQKEKKNSKINQLSQNIAQLNKKIENLEFENERLQETTALNSIQMTQKEQILSEYESKYNSKCDEIQQMNREKNLLEAKLKVSIKEIIKLRGALKDKEEHKNTLLTKLSEMSNDLRSAHNENELMNDEYLSKFQAISHHLNNVHSKLESFSVTIRNFSGAALKQSFDTELEARLKSNEELPAWKENIKVQLQKATQQMGSNAQQDALFNNANNHIKESETHIAHIKLTGLQILHEYTSLLMQYNDLYILHNDDNNHCNHKKLFQRKKSSKV